MEYRCSSSTGQEKHNPNGINLYWNNPLQGVPNAVSPYLFKHWNLIVCLIKRCKGILGYAHVSLRFIKTLLKWLVMLPNSRILCDTYHVKKRNFS